MKQMNRYAFVSMVAGLLFWVLTCVAPLSAAQQNPCTEDIAKFCKNVGSERMAVMNCLEVHESQLSAACKDYEAKVLEGRKGERREDVKTKKKFLQSCKGDIAKFCKGTDPNAGGYVKCIYDHQSELSPPCAAWIKEHQKEQTKTK